MSLAGDLPSTQVAPSSPHSRLPLGFAVLPIDNFLFIRTGSDHGWIGSSRPSLNKGNSKAGSKPGRSSRMTRCPPRFHLVPRLFTRQQRIGRSSGRVRSMQCMMLFTSVPRTVTTRHSRQLPSVDCSPSPKKRKHIGRPSQKRPATTSATSGRTSSRVTHMNWMTSLLRMSTS